MTERPLTDYEVFALCIPIGLTVGLLLDHLLVEETTAAPLKPSTAPRDVWVKLSKRLPISGQTALMLSVGVIRPQNNTPIVKMAACHASKPANSHSRNASRLLMLAH